jgi:hypothetical protein
MAASGTTKKVTSNQILGSGGVATLASATITGDLTVDTSTLKVDSTNNRVIVGHTSGSAAFQVTNAGAAGLEIQPTGFSSAPLIQSYNRSGSAYTQLTLDGSTIVHALSGTTAMTLNSTGLGVGGSPVNPLTVFAAASAKAPALLLSTVGSPTYGWDFSVDGATTGNLFIRRLVAGTKTDVLEFDRSSGNVGIGGAPSAWGSAFKSIQQVNYGTSFFSSNGGSSGLASNCYNDGTNWLYSSNNPPTRYEFGVDAGNHRWFSAAAGTGTVAFGSAKMTLDANGYLLVGTTSTSVTNGGVVTYGISAGQLAIGHATGTAGATAYAGFQYAGTEIGSITQNGTTGVLYNIVSDYRLKESVVPLSGGLARVNALKPSVYNWKSDGSTGEGFLAHELAEVVPFAVSGEKDAVDKDGKIKSQGIDMSRVVPILVAAIQELTAEVNALKNA